MENQNFSNSPSIVGNAHSRDVDLILKSVADKKSIKDFLLDDSEDAEIIQSFEPRILPQGKAVLKEAEHSDNVQPFNSTPATPAVRLESKEDISSKPFIVANTTEIPLLHLQHDCIIPVFSKDNEKTIAHQEFIEVILEAVTRVFPQQTIAEPEIRVSHQIKGRTPAAIHKSAKDLLEEDKTIYYERMAFMVKIPSVTEEINGNKLSLCVGGIRSYNQENLYSKKSLEKFKFFIGFQNFVCMNLCISTDGFLENLRVSNANELGLKALEVMQNYNAELHLMEMKELTHDYLSEHQFAQLIGKSRLYQHLPKPERQRIPELNFNDSHINTMAKDYYEDQNFSRMEDGRINLWNVFNLFTQANKNSYIDTFLDRNLNAFEFSKGLQKTLNGNSDYHWFLS